jgi:hypothetical protein
MKINVIAYPQFIEVDSLLNKYQITDVSIDKSLIREAIFEIRQTHGVFQKNQFKAVVSLLEHDWLPSDIPVLLPEPTSLCGV